jgi:DNA-directed RNA polymerase specialized sigma24 family protein
MDRPSLGATARRAGTDRGTGPAAGDNVVASTARNRLVRSTGAQVYRLTYGLTPNPHDAEDLTQDVFVRVFRYLPGYIPGASGGRLYRMTVKLFRGVVRRNGCVRRGPLRAGDALEAFRIRPGGRHVG